MMNMQQAIYVQVNVLSALDTRVRHKGRRNYTAQQNDVHLKLEPLRQQSADSPTPTDI